jgi:hypothetical protein
MSRVGSRLVALEKRSAALRPRHEERDEEFEAVMAKVRETPEGREAVEDFEAMLAEATDRIVPADGHPKVAVVKAARRLFPERYVDTVGRFNDHYFAAREGREPHRFPFGFGQQPKP